VHKNCGFLAINMSESDQNLKRPARVAPERLDPDHVIPPDSRCVEKIWILRDSWAGCGANVPRLGGAAQAKRV
jgi:hypothetical protein